MNLYIDPINHVSVDEHDELLSKSLDRNTSCVSCLNQPRWSYECVYCGGGLINVNITSDMCIPICEHWRCEYEIIY